MKCKNMKIPVWFVNMKGNILKKKQEDAQATSWLTTQSTIFRSTRLRVVLNLLFSYNY